MTLLEMIREWRNGCSDASDPVYCHQCTNGLIDAMERKLIKQVAIEKLKAEFEVELSKIKQGDYGFATLALSVACVARYAAQVKNIPSTKINLNLFSESACNLKTVKVKVKDVSNFNYPECLDRIVQAGVKAAEAKILEFKELDRVQAEHDEMMSNFAVEADRLWNTDITN